MLSLSASTLAQAAGSQSQTASDQTLLVWALVLIGMAFALFIVEVFVPSGGIIGICGSVLLVVGIVMLFGVSTALGLIGSIVSLIAIPCIVLVGMKLWPDLPMARWLILQSSRATGGSDDATDEAPAPEVITAGDTGKAVTDLRPVGTCLIRGRREECLSAAGQIETGQTVRVVDVDGMQIKVVAER